MQVLDYRLRHGEIRPRPPHYYEYKHILVRSLLVTILGRMLSAVFRSQLTAFGRFQPVRNGCYALSALTEYVALARAAA